MSLPRGIKRPHGFGVCSERSPSPLTDLEEERDKESSESSFPASQRKSKKFKRVFGHTTTSPFPSYLHPTKSEAHAVHALLSQEHGSVQRLPLDTTNSSGTCGDSPDVLDALISTILSQNTTAANSTRAKRDLDNTFGLHNFAAIATAPQERVYDAIRHGGLARKKSEAIQALLRAVHARHDEYSLQHLAAPNVTNTQAMLELQEYDGVGPKTAACVLLFSLRRDVFAVDTHVFRLSRLLRWVPASADRITAQMHLDVRIPPEIKYALHVLMVQHGRRCKGCKGPGGKGPCVLKTWSKKVDGVEKIGSKGISEKCDVKAEGSMSAF